jgi:broad specificity phosphatase PhoE
MVLQVAAAGGSSGIDGGRETPTNTKDLWILRHGQAVHNPRAEAAREAGCTHDEFLELMRQDDCLDAPLTELGMLQATHVRELYGSVLWSSPDNGPQCIVSSPLQRALQTAELVLGASTSSNGKPRMVVYEGFREINGWLLNAQRQSKSALSAQFPHWNLDALSTEHDELWTDILEDRLECAQRGTRGLHWLAASCPERRILLVAHGAILAATLANAPTVTLRDARRRSGTNAPAPPGTATPHNAMDDSNSPRPVQARFQNCELRRYRMEYTSNGPISSSTDALDATTDSCDMEIVLTEFDLDADDEITAKM